MYALTQMEVEIGTSNVVANQISIANTSADTLINSRASHSFVFDSFIQKLDMFPKLLDDVCNISFPWGKKLPSWFSLKAVHVKIDGKELPIDLIVLEMVDYDVVLGMDWLSKHNATIFCKKKVAFQPFEEENFEYKGTPRRSKWLVISAIKASKMLTKGCIGYLANIVDKTKKVKSHVVCKFLNVFLE